MSNWSKRKKVLSVVAVLALFSGVAVAALILFTGSSGNGTAKVASAQTQSAITFSPASVPSTIDVGTTPFQVHVTNNDSTAAHVLTSLNGVVTTSPDASCAQYISYAAGNAVGLNIPAGYNSDDPIGTLTVSASMPASCGGVDVNVALSGSTNP